MFFSYYFCHRFQLLEMDVRGKVYRLFHIEKLRQGDDGDVLIVSQLQ